MRRKVFGKQPRDRRDALDDATLDLTGAKLGLLVAADRLPAAGSDTRMDTAIGDDLDVAIGEQNIDQHAVIVCGVPDPQLREQVERTLARGLVAKQGRAVERTFHHEAHLSRMRGLASLDGLPNTIERRRRKYLPYPPTMYEKMPRDTPHTHLSSSPSPPPRSAAAPKPAAASGEAAAVARVAAAAPAARCGAADPAAAGIPAARGRPSGVD